MQSKLLAEADGLRTFAIILETGDEVMASLKAFAQAEELAAAQFSAIGAFRDAVISYFDWDTKSYIDIPVDEQVEVASLTGDVTLDPEGKRALHVHTVLGRRDGSARAGHLTKGHVRPTLEVVLTETPAHLHKRHDPESGLALIRIP
ncbi:PPC domain-containing DNA-binding protein [Azorhizobium oxalatiphilum]|uniref:PPC domain-containing DNA-binding protein n=1 Tax=Azorhizobium oxalatiphilum TaxID=980631 RepID=UPI0035A24DD3